MDINREIHCSKNTRNWEKKNWIQIKTKEIANNMKIYTVTKYLRLILIRKDISKLVFSQVLIKIQNLKAQISHLVSNMVFQP